MKETFETIGLIALAMILGTIFFSVLGSATCQTASDAFLSYGKVNQPIVLTTDCGDCSYVNISSITYPNGTKINVDFGMTQYKSSFNYNFLDTGQQGDYFYTTFGTNSNNDICVQTVRFTINDNGKAPPSGSIVVLFVIAFIILTGLTCYLAVYTIGHLMSLDFDIIDLAFDWGLFIAILALYILESTYLSNSLMESYFVWFISVAGMLLILVSSVSFLLSITIGSLNKKKMNTTNAPAKFRLRRMR